MTTPDAEREAFEAWMATTRKVQHLDQVAATNKRIFDAGAWIGWQARAKLKRKVRKP
jgi:hypothetical protein